MTFLDERAPTTERLLSEEDGTLRRLHYFQTSGITLAGPMQSLKDEIRARDQRSEIRDPLIDAVISGT